MAGGKGGQNFVAKTCTTYMYIIITICSITYNTVRIYATCNINAIHGNSSHPKKTFRCFKLPVLFFCREKKTAHLFFCWASIKKPVGFQLIWTPNKNTQKSSWPHVSPAFFFTAGVSSGPPQRLPTAVKYGFDEVLIPKR